MIVLRHRNRPGIDTQVPVYLHRAERLEAPALMSNSQTDRSGAKLKPPRVIPKSISLPDVMEQLESQEKGGEKEYRKGQLQKIFYYLLDYLIHSSVLALKEISIVSAIQPSKYVVSLTMSPSVNAFTLLYVLLLQSDLLPL